MQMQRQRLQVVLKKSQPMKKLIRKKMQIRRTYKEKETQQTKRWRMRRKESTWQTTRNVLVTRPVRNFGTSILNQVLALNDICLFVGIGFARNQCNISLVQIIVFSLAVQLCRPCSLDGILGSPQVPLVWQCSHWILQFVVVRKPLNDLKFDEEQSVCAQLGIHLTLSTRSIQKKH